MLKFLVKVFISLCLLNMLMDQVDNMHVVRKLITLHVVRYWSEVLCCTMAPHLCDLEVKVKDLKFYVKVFGLIFMPPTSNKLRGHIGLGLSVQSSPVQCSPLQSDIL